jgi:zinc and cadmium transporter
MDSPGVSALVSVVLVSLLSLIGIVTLTISVRRLQHVIFVLVSLAAGALFGDVFFHLLPEAYHAPDHGTSAAGLVLAGIAAFFILEKCLHWQHAPHLHAATRVDPVGYMNLIADGLHNLIDGALIGAAYLSSFPVGLATTIAVILHEIPQELGDFGILLHAGFRPRQALWWNFVSASLAIVGAVGALVLGAQVLSVATLMLPLAAGGFLYIAGSDLLPELQQERALGKSVVQCTAMSCGVGVMWLLTWLER